MTEKDEELFDPNSFGVDEFKHWYKSDDRKITFCGHQASLKRLRSRLGYYCDSGVVTTHQAAHNIMEVVKL